jgi:hypothetical protein
MLYQLSYASRFLPAYRAKLKEVSTTALDVQQNFPSGPIRKGRLLLSGYPLPVRVRRQCYDALSPMILPESGCSRPLCRSGF